MSTSARPIYVGGEEIGQVAVFFVGEIERAVELSGRGECGFGGRFRVTGEGQSAGLAKRTSFPNPLRDDHFGRLVLRRTDARSDRPFTRQETSEAHLSFIF